MSKYLFVKQISFGFYVFSFSDSNYLELFEGIFFLKLEMKKSFPKHWFLLGGLQPQNWLDVFNKIS